MGQVHPQSQAWKRNNKHSLWDSLVPPQPPMPPVVRPLGLLLAAASLLPLAASAVPIRAADGVSTSVPGRQAGPRHPGVVTVSPPSADLGSASLSTNRRGRPVPGLNKTLSNRDGQRARVAEGVPSPSASQL